MPIPPDAEIPRMLAWFKAQLPPHELDSWYITQQSADHDVIENTDDVHVAVGYGSSPRVRIAGYGRCSRCGARFDIPTSGNFVTHPERVAVTVENAKEWVSRDAERDGPCWGDVPHIENYPTTALMDCGAQS